jgi:hypothetical protein
MDPSSLAAAAVSASVGQAQLGFAGKMLAMNIDSGRSAVKLIDAAQQNFDRLANVSAGIGTNLDVTA